MISPVLLLALAVTATPEPGKALTLDEAVRVALERQPLLAQARSNTEVAQARADQSRAPLLPQVSLGASYLLGTGNTADSGPASFASGGRFNLSAGVSQLVWDFGTTWNRWQSSLSLAEAQQSQERAIRLQTVLNVEVAYFAARAQKELVGVARETLENLAHHLQQIEGFVQVGTRAPIDLAQARTDSANAKVQLINAENGFRTALAQLNFSMGVEGGTDYDLADSEFPAPAAEGAAFDKLMEHALSTRPEFTALERQVRAQQLVITAIGGNYWPSLGFSTGVTDAGPSLDRLTWNWSAQLSLSWGVFQGGLTVAQQREARANLLNLESQRDLLRQQVRLQVEQANLGVEGAKAALQASDEALANARERLRLAEGRYQAGAGSIIELGDAQVAVTSTGAQLAQAHFNVATARARLLQSLGETR